MAENVREKGINRRLLRGSLSFEILPLEVAGRRAAAIAMGPLPLGILMAGNVREKGTNRWLLRGSLSVEILPLEAAGRRAAAIGMGPLPLGIVLHGREARFLFPAQTHWRFDELSVHQ